MQGFAFASNQEEGLDRRHSELVVREMAKFHAISYCMKLKGGSSLDECNAALLERYPYLSEDSLYRQSTEDFTKRTITPVMASLAEVLRKAGHDYAAHYFHRLQMETVRVRNDFAVVCHGDLWMSNILFRSVAYLLLPSVPRHLARAQTLVTRTQATQWPSFFSCLSTFPKTIWCDLFQ